MWAPASEVTNVATITKLRKQLLFHCLEYLTDWELFSVRKTCVWFQDAFFDLTRKGEDHHLSLTSDNRNYRFKSLTELFIVWGDGFEILKDLNKIDFKHQLPKLAELKLRGKMINILKFPKIESLTKLIFWKSNIFVSSSNEKEHKNKIESIDDIFAGLKELVLRQTSWILPNVMLKHLVSLNVCHSRIDTDLALPGLRDLTLISDDSMLLDRLKVGNRLQGLAIEWSGTENVTLTPMNSVTHLKIKKRGNVKWLLTDLPRLFPNLRYLFFFCPYYGEFFPWYDMRAVSRHPLLETLVVGSKLKLHHGFRLEHLNDVNFPCLTKVATTALQLDITDLTNPKPNIIWKELTSGMAENTTDTAIYYLNPKS